MTTQPTIHRPTVEQIGRIHIRKHGGLWLVKRYRNRRVFVIHTAQTFKGVEEYMAMRRNEW